MLGGKKKCSNLGLMVTHFLLQTDTVFVTSYRILWWFPK